LDDRGRCPVEEFIESQGDAKIRAKIVKKLQMLSQCEPDDVHRALVDTIDGPVKELRVDKQVRILFSWERESGHIVALEAERKKNGKLSDSVIQRATKNRETWLESRLGKTLG